MRIRLDLWRINNFFATLPKSRSECEHPKAHIRKDTACLEHFSITINFKSFRNYRNFEIRLNSKSSS